MSENHIRVKPCKTHLVSVSVLEQRRSQRVRSPVCLSRRPRVYFVLDVFGEVQRARERDHKHDEERDDGPDEESVQTAAAGAPGGRLALNICGRGHLEKQRANKAIYIHSRYSSV